MIYLPSWIPFTRKNRTNRVYDYEFEDVHQYEGSDETHAGIRIKNGPYKGLLYAYRKVQLIPNEEEDNCRAKFDWIPIENVPENNTQDLHDALGNILMDIMEKNPPDNETMDVNINE